jgi:hypothetical protein
MVIDPLSEMKRIYSEKFLMGMGRIFAQLVDSPVDKAKGLSQTHYSIRNKWFLDYVKQKIRKPKLWTFASIAVTEKPEWVKEVQKIQKNIWWDSNFNIDWVSRFPETVDNISSCIRIASKKSITDDQYLIRYKKGPLTPEKILLDVSGDKYIVQKYFNNIAKSLMGK